MPDSIYPSDDLNAASSPALEEQVCLDSGSLDSMQDRIESSGSISHSRYEIVEGIGEGGMGVVVLARDRYLQRNLAMKVIAASKANDPAFVDRFIEEAQIAGQLQHPSIVPIHDIGKLQDDRPYFTMKLIRGETLEALLKKRESLADEMPKWIGVFVQICQAVAYAHAKHVIHRDLKPSNVMIGRFGDVQVMDWGLAKILPGLPTDTSGGSSEPISTDPAPERRPEVTKSIALENESAPMESIVQSIRYSSRDEHSENSNEAMPQDHTSSLTSLGFVLGTLAYMPPEQAAGSPDLLTTSSDVFALGALLCHIMTGKPPYVASSKSELHELALFGNTTAAKERLSQSPFDVELQQLASRCLAKEPVDRPRDASVIVDFIAQHTAQTDERRRKAELERTAAEAKFEANQLAYLSDLRRRRWVWGAGLATSLLALSLTVSYFWIKQSKTALQLAQSKATVAELQETQERNNRVEQGRRSAQQISIPLEIAIMRLRSKPERPTKAEFRKFETELEQARPLMAEWVHLGFQEAIPAIDEQFRAMRQLAQMLDTMQTPLTLAALETLLAGEVETFGTSAKPDRLFGFDGLPVWGQRELSTAIQNSIYRYSSIPRSFEASLEVNSFEKSMWQSIQDQDIARLRAMTLSDEVDQQPLETLLVLSQTLLDEGPRFDSTLALKELDWVILYPTTAVSGNATDIPVSKDGWIEVPVSLNTDKYHVEANLPDQNLRYFRIETYCGTIQEILDLSRDAKSAEYAESELRRISQTNVTTVPTFEPDLGTSKSVGPGTGGLGPDFCLIREWKMSRVLPDGVRVPLKLQRYYSEHDATPGRQVDAAFDQDESTHWAMGHAGNASLASTILETQSLSAVQAQGKLDLDITAGAPDLWQPTCLGRFRLYYAKPSETQQESSVLVAQKLLDRMERRFPANPEILNQLARSRIESGVVAELNREAAIVLASTALTIEPENRQSLLFFTETVLAGQTRVENTWYTRLISLLDSIADTDLKKSIEERVARYQSERGDRLHSLHPGTAFEAYVASERLAPDRFQRHGRLAYEYWRKGKPDRAIEVAKQGVASEIPDAENLFYYGTIAFRTNRSDEAFLVFQRWFERGVAAGQTDRLKLLYAKICFAANQMQAGKTLLQELQSKVVLTPSVITSAAICTITDSKTDEIPWLMDFWSQFDTPELTQSKDITVFRERRIAWGALAMSAIASEQSSLLEQSLRTKLTSHPIVLDEVCRIVDALLMERTQPLAPFINMDNALRLIRLFQTIQPDEPRWSVRHALLKWLQGNSTEPIAMLEKLPIQSNEAGESIFDAKEGRHWSCMARVVLATIRMVEADREAQQKGLATDPKWKEGEIAAAQECLGRVPEPDRDLAEWLWWEYRIDHSSK